MLLDIKVSKERMADIQVEIGGMKGEFEHLEKLKPKNQNLTRQNK